MVCRLSVQELRLAELSILHSRSDKFEVLSDLRFFLNLNTVKLAHFVQVTWENLVSDSTLGEVFDSSFCDITLLDVLEEFL